MQTLLVCIATRRRQMLTSLIAYPSTNTGSIRKYGYVCEAICTRICGRRLVDTHNCLKHGAWEDARCDSKRPKAVAYVRVYGPVGAGR